MSAKESVVTVKARTSSEMRWSGLAILADGVEALVGRHPRGSGRTIPRVMVSRHRRPRRSSPKRAITATTVKAAKTPT